MKPKNEIPVVDRMYSSDRFFMPFYKLKQTHHGDNVVSECVGSGEEHTAGRYYSRPYSRHARLDVPVHNVFCWSPVEKE